MCLGRGVVHVPNCNSFLFTEAKRNMSGDEDDFNNKENRIAFKFFPSKQGAEGFPSLSDRKN